MTEPPMVDGRFISSSEQKLRALQQRAAALWAEIHASARRHAALDEEGAKFVADTYASLGLTLPPAGDEEEGKQDD